jgi:hypothetical protein
MFGLYGEVSFSPFYVPSRMTLGKERRVDRTENFCGGEDVSDMGAKNREFHISGVLREKEIDAFNDLLDAGSEFEMVAPAWSGEVMLEDGEVEGPKATDPQTGQWLYQYSMNVVSTGRDEAHSGHGNHGLIDDGTGDFEADYNGPAFGL